MCVPGAAQQPDPALKELQEMARRAGAEGNKFREAGGRPGAADDPAKKWAAALWEFRERHPGTEAAGRAGYLAIAWLMFAHDFDGAIAKVEKLQPNDAAWERVVRYFATAAANTGQAAYFVKKITSLLPDTRDKRVRARLRIELGRAHLDLNRPEEARAAFRAVIDELPDSDMARIAAANLDEISRLDVGKAAPAFEARTLDGALVSPRELRGKVVLLNFWGTW